MSAHWTITPATDPDADADDVTGYVLVRDGAEGVGEVRLHAPDGARFDEVVSFTLRDLDGDGADEVLVVARWTRRVRVVPARHEDDDAPADGDDFAHGCWIATTERADQLYVVRALGAALAVAFTHVVDYATETSAAEEITDHAEPERVSYAWDVVPGAPAAVRLDRLAHELDGDLRLAGLLDPARDPLFAAGPGAALTIR